MFITMLRTNNKKARENVRNYIIAEFTPEGYTDNPPQEFPEIARFILTTFRREKYHLPQDFRYYRHNEYVAFADWCAGLAGGFKLLGVQALGIITIVQPLTISAQSLKRRTKKKQNTLKIKPKTHPCIRSSS